MAAILDIRGLAAAYGDLQALWDVTFDVPERAVTTLLGSNGAGKTTTLRVVSGTLPATSGEVRVAGERISGRSAHRIVDLGVVQVPEGRHLWPNMTVEDNLLLGAYSQRARSARATSRRLRRASVSDLANVARCADSCVNSRMRSTAASAAAPRRPRRP